VSAAPKPGGKGRSAKGKASERRRKLGPALKDPPAPKALAYKVVGYPHLSMALILGRVYTVAELESRCGNHNPKRRRLLHTRLADRTVFQQATLSAALRRVDAAEDLPKWARGPAICPSSGEKEVLQRCRRIADGLAKTILEKANGEAISDSDMLQVLRAWGFRRNDARKNVLPQGKDWVHSDTLGLVRSRDGRVILGGASRKHPYFTRLALAWLRGKWPRKLRKDFPITSISVNSQYAARRHRDGSNAGPSLIRALGKFYGGRLRYWPSDPGGDVEALRRKDAVTLNIRNVPRTFDGNFAHEVTAFKGERFSLVFFSVGRWWKTTPATRKLLRGMNFTFPTTESLRAAKKHVLDEKL